MSYHAKQGGHIGPPYNRSVVLDFSGSPRLRALCVSVVDSPRLTRVMRGPVHTLFQQAKGAFDCIGVVHADSIAPYVVNHSVLPEAPPDYVVSLEFVGLQNRILADVLQHDRLD
jgi:hypothetical protein